MSFAYFSMIFFPSSETPTMTSPFDANFSLMSRT